MFLTADNIVHYLLERNLVPASQIVNGDYTVVEAPRRNRNFKVMRRDGGGLFLKQVQHWDQPSLSTIQTEAQCYRLTSDREEFAALRPLVPKFYCYDDRRAILTTELLSGGQSLSEYYFQAGEFPGAIARQLGEAFGSYHRRVKSAANESTQPKFPRMQPWVLSFHRASSGMLQNGSGGNRQLLETLQRYPDFGRMLDQLAADWKFESLIHGDIKWDNCVLVRGPKGGVTLKLVDWELADWGDPCWDVGSVFSAFIVFWIQSLPLGPGVEMAQARFPIEKMQPAIQSFWKSYASGMDLDAAAEQTLLRRSVLLCGARTIQTAYEYVQAAPEMSALAYVILQASLNILTSPAEATNELLGLRMQ